MHLMRVLMPLAGWHRRLIRAFLALSDGAEQQAFWKRHLDTRRFRIGLDVLMSRAMLRRVYAPQLVSALPARFGGILRERLERGFARHPNVENPYAQALLLGAKNQPLPEPVRTIRFVAGDAASWLESAPASSFDAFTLSNILDGAAWSYHERLSRAVRHAAAQGAVVVLRSFAEPIRPQDRNHSELDRSMLWGSVDVRPADTWG
jgi:S-adenosylmethionine:diacylglycerol 3-amino-3-carboxypropyl transferase